MYKSIKGGSNNMKIRIITLFILLGLVLVGCNAESESTTESIEQSTKTTSTDTNTTVDTDTPESESFYYTANEGGSITKINSSTDEVVKTIQVDGLVHNVQVSPDNKLLGATVVPMNDHHGEDDGQDKDSHSHGDESAEAGKVIFYDIATDEMIKSIDVGSHPAHIDFSNDGKYVLVTNTEENNVTVIDLSTFTVAKLIETGKGPHGFRISADSQYAYIANMSEDTVSVVNLQTMTEEKRLKVGQTPVTTGVTSDEKLLVATLHVENMVAIVDLATKQVEKVEVGNGPAQVYVDSNSNIAYVANQGSKDSPSNSVSVVDLTSRMVTATIQTGKGAHGLVTSGDGKRLYVTNMFENTVTVIDVAENKAIATIEVGEIPNGISIMN
jgi:YVTN family beta-propeller protein